MSPARTAVIDPDRYDAVLFDLDGVITDTAKVHALCWKRMFDEFLRKRAENSGAPMRTFDIETDYADYVDGKPRFEGVQSFLASRGIELPFGSADDPPGSETVCGLGNRKNALLQEVLQEEGVDLFPDAVVLLRQLHALGLRTAVVSSSRNCAAVLEAAGIGHLFEQRVDGETAARLDLPGKPAPDIFLKAAERLGVPSSRAVVLEDAISGVQAGRAGDFGLVVGVARAGNARTLLRHGADIAVTDLTSLLPSGSRSDEETRS